MDPNANLAEQLEVAKEIADIWDHSDNDGKLTVKQLMDLSDAAYRLSELVLALNEWISKGGFIPQKWQVSK